MNVKSLNHYTINKVTTDLKVNPFSILKLISKLYDDWVTLHAQSENFTTLPLSTCKDWNKCIYSLCKYSMFGNVKDFYEINSKFLSFHQEFRIYVKSTLGIKSLQVLGSYVFTLFIKESWCTYLIFIIMKFVIKLGLGTLK